MIEQQSKVGITDIPTVGGKNASLGEMIQQLKPKGVKVPTGFATTAYAYRYFMQAGDETLERAMNNSNLLTSTPSLKSGDSNPLPD